MNNKIFLQITSGRGPAECCRVVALVLERIISTAKKKGLTTEVLEREEGVINRTLFSATLSIEGEKESLDEIANEWVGTILWISKSPYRIYHKRKNWFIGVNSFTVPSLNDIDSKDFEYQTLRASGPGGQHVNKTESAVRVTHIPSGLSVTASDQRSQIQNKKLATERLLVKLESWKIEEGMKVAQSNWINHNSLERGNPIKTIDEPLR